MMKCFDLLYEKTVLFISIACKHVAEVVCSTIFCEKLLRIEFPENILEKEQTVNTCRPAVTCSESPLLSRIKLAGPVHPEQQLLPAKDSGLQNLNKIPRS